MRGSGDGEALEMGTRSQRMGVKGWRLKLEAKNWSPEGGGLEMKGKGWRPEAENCKSRG